MGAPVSFQPLLPDERTGEPLVERAAALVAESQKLQSSVGTLSSVLGPLLRAMNSYYSNRIEGQHTRPADIERALAKQFDADEQRARKQRLAVAHIEAEAALEARLPLPRAKLYEAELVSSIHRELYGRLPAAEQLTADGQKLTPGAFRTGLVTAGRHLAPPAERIQPLLAEWSAYAELPGLEHALVGAVCSHHRLLWVHPFSDGNGRAARLHTHLVLTSLGVTAGVWSPLRGMARDHEGYYARLNNADLPRRNDLDGRGSLSQEELVKFAQWLLDLCLDQARFMGGLLALSELKARLLDLLRWLGAHPWPVGAGETSVIKADALEALHYVALVGPIERARFQAMTGLSPRTSRRVLTSLLDFGLLVADGPRSPVRFGVPFASLRFLFPRLWPEAESD